MATSLAAQRARIGGLALAASHDPKIYTAAARARFLDRFIDEVDPDRCLPEAERVRRAAAARRLYFARLALAASLRRRRRSSSGGAATNGSRHDS
jgi:hypothetical protein